MSVWQGSLHRRSILLRLPISEAHCSSSLLLPAASPLTRQLNICSSRHRQSRVQHLISLILHQHALTYRVTTLWWSWCCEYQTWKGSFVALELYFTPAWARPTELDWPRGRLTAVSCCLLRVSLPANKWVGSPV